VGGETETLNFPEKWEKFWTKTPTEKKSQQALNLTGRNPAGQSRRSNAK